MPELIIIISSRFKRKKYTSKSGKLPHWYFGFFGVGGWAIENQIIRIRTVAEGILRPEGDSASENANKRIIQGVVEWMEKNKNVIEGVDNARPLLPQLDLLIEEQLVAAIRSFDPLYAQYAGMNN